MFSSESFLVQRAFLKIQGFQFTLIPIAGCLNYCPDTWSRLHYLSNISNYPIILAPPTVETELPIMPLDVLPVAHDLDIFDRPPNPMPHAPVDDEPYFVPPLDHPPQVTFNIPNIKWYNYSYY